MNIAIFTNNYLPNPYGVSMSIESFRFELEKRGHTVYIFAPFYKNHIDKNPNVFRFPSIDFKYKISFPLAIPYSYKISRLLDELQIDVIHAQHPNLLGSAAKRWAKKKNVPLVFTWHTLYDKYAHFVPLIPSVWAAKWAINNAVKYANIADQVIVPTKSVKKIIVDWGVKNENIVAIPTGVDEVFLQESDREGVRKNLRIGSDEIVLLLLCRLTAEKNVQFLMSAVIKVLKKNSQIKFILAGDGHELPILKNMITLAQLEKQVIFQGIVDRITTKNLYSAADVFVYASISETQGMILTEAMTMGLPIVAVSATGAKDIIGNHVTGLLVEENEDAFASAVLKLVRDQNLRKTFSENAKKIAQENYTAAICGEKLLKTYDDAIERKKKNKTL